ncbi:matrilin-2-like [Haliotis asinina]|uniref:matrilin-2-like n=1 Tax=Haliotis asinina TaxID=109174 RepID=UPI003531D1EE
MTLLKEIMSRILLGLFLFSFCSGQMEEEAYSPHGQGNQQLKISDPCSIEYTMSFTDIVHRWPYYIRNRTIIDDSTNEDALYVDILNGKLLDYPPGVGRCGGKYSIWQKELREGSAVVCVQNEVDTCFKEFEVKYRDCRDTFKYGLGTEVKDSVFCLQPTFCHAFDYLCENGGTCIEERDGFSCQCPDGYSGPTCEGDPCSISRPLPRLDLRLPTNHVAVPSKELYFSDGWKSAPKGMKILNQCRPGPLDILIIEDVSSSVINSDYRKMKDFILNIVRHLNISRTETSVAFLSFANTAKVGFHLDTYNNTMDVVETIASAHGEGGGTLVSSALELSASDVFTYHNGDRADADNIVLLFTDGIFKDQTSLKQDVEALKAKAEIYVVTVGPVVSNTTVAEVATSPDHILKLGDHSTATVITSALNPDPTCGAEQETVYEGR